MSYVLFFSGILLASIGFGFVYLRSASLYGPYAIPNFRSLHQNVIPKGGGIAIAVSVLVGLLLFNLQNNLGMRHLMVFFIGGLVIAAAGYADDWYDIRPRYRLAVQMLASLWICFWFGGLPVLDLGFMKIHLGLFGDILLIISCLWFYNLYNFIDGIDGMAASATIFISLTMVVILLMEKQYDLAFILGLLAVANIGFILFNWPPARMFLGDSGTSFISYVVSAVAIASLWRNAVSIWVWLIVFGYYFSDTTLTTVIRALTVPRFYLPHRSHAYQNLARIWDSHLKTLLLVLAINLFWVLPFVWLVWKYPKHAAFAMVIAYAPILLFCAKYGPRFEDK